MADELLTAVSEDGLFLAHVAHTSELVTEALRRHLPGELAATALARALTTAALFPVGKWKALERISLQWSGQGPLGTVLAEYRKPGHLRGFVTQPNARIEKEYHGWRGIGWGLVPGGYVSVLRQQEDGRFGQSQAQLRNGEIDEDLEEFFEKSEQAPTRLRAMVSIEEPEMTATAVGVLIQALPGADPDALPDKKIHERIAAQSTAEELFTAAFGHDRYKILETTPLTFACPCSRERIAAGIGLVENDELLEMINEDQGAQVRCDFCATRYTFSREDLEDILARKLTGDL